MNSQTPTSIVSTGVGNANLIVSHWNRQGIVPNSLVPSSTVPPPPTTLPPNPAFSSSVVNSRASSPPLWSNSVTSWQPQMFGQNQHQRNFFSSNNQPQNNNAATPPTPPSSFFYPQSRQKDGKSADPSNFAQTAISPYFSQPSVCRPTPQYTYQPPRIPVNTNINQSHQNANANLNNGYFGANYPSGSNREIINVEESPKVAENQLIDLTIPDWERRLALSYTPSDEQMAVIRAAVDGIKNVCVMSSAGAGKTTLALMIALAMNPSRVHVITYNKNLQMASEKRGRGLPNIEFHTVHAWLGHRLGRIFQNDQQLQAIVNEARTIDEDFVSVIDAECDLLIVDEAQDLRPPHIDALQLVLMRCENVPKLVVLGHLLQLIYDFGEHPATGAALKSPETLLKIQETSEINEDEGEMKICGARLLSDASKTTVENNQICGPRARETAFCSSSTRENDEESSKKRKLNERDDESEDENDSDQQTNKSQRVTASPDSSPSSSFASTIELEEGEIPPEQINLNIVQRTEVELAKNWTFLNLAASYRVPKNIADFVSLHMLKEPGALTGVNPGGEVQLVSRNLYDAEKVAGQIANIVAKFGSSNVAVLSRFVKDNDRLVNTANVLRLKFGVNVRFITDEHGRHGELAGDAVTFRSIHSAKGCEWDAVIYHGFRYYKRGERGESGVCKTTQSAESLDDSGDDKCPNLDYVAATRAKKLLVFLRHNADELPSYLDKSHAVFKTPCLVCLFAPCRCRLSTCNKCSKSKRTCSCACPHPNCPGKVCTAMISVTDLVRHAPCDSICKKANLEWVEGHGNGSEIPVPSHAVASSSDGSYFAQDIRDVVGVAVTAMHSHRATGRADSLYSFLEPKDNERAQVFSANVTGMKLSPRIRCLRRMQGEAKYDGTAATMRNLLKASANYIGIRTGFDARIDQLDEGTYNWFSFEDGSAACDNLDTLLGVLGVLPETLRYEVPVDCLIPGNARRVSGRIDLMADDAAGNLVVIELKFKAQLETADILQVALYAHMLQKEVSQTRCVRALVFNMRTSHWIQIDDDPGSLQAAYLLAAAHHVSSQTLALKSAELQSQKNPNTNKKKGSEIHTKEICSKSLLEAQELRSALLEPARLVKLFPDPDDLQAFLNKDQTVEFTRKTSSESLQTTSSQVSEYL